MSTKGKGGTATLEPPAALAEIPEGAIALKWLALSEIAESPLNPRKRFDDAALDELGASMLAKGQLTPVLVRPHASGHGVYELAAGHRRFRSAKRVGMEGLWALVKPMDDTTFLEVLTIENLQREDPHPLEEADGYAELIEQARYDVAKIAASVGKSERYIYDRLKLRTLAPEVRELFFAGHLELAHCIELARIPQEKQREAVAISRIGGYGNSDGLFYYLEPDFFHHQDKATAQAFETEKQPADPYAHYKAKSVRELKAWIQRHVRADAGADHLAIDLPESAADLADATEAGEPVVPITFSHALHPDTKASGVRTLTVRSWKLADERRGAKPCERSQLGFVVEGVGHGQTFRICAAKKQCKVHWGKEIKERERAAKADAKSASRNGAKQRPREQPWERDRRLRNAQDVAFEKHAAAIYALAAKRIQSISVAPGGPLDTVLFKHQLQAAYGVDKKAAALVGRGKGADGLVRRLAWISLLSDELRSGLDERSKKALKALGIALPKAITDDMAAVVKSEMERTKPGVKAANEPSGAVDEVDGDIDEAAA